MLTLFLHSLRDGWAIVRSGPGLHLLRPPYAEPTGPGISEREAFRWFEGVGFQVVEQVFADWPAVFAHLQEARVAATGAVSEEEVQAAAQRILGRASLERLVYFADRAEGLLNEGQPEAAGRILAQLGEVPRVGADSVLFGRVGALLARAEAAG